MSIHHYLNGKIRIQVLDKADREEQYSENLKSEPARVETYTALPCRHINERRKRHITTDRRIILV